jgi:tRNA dimethylallyltransferase
MQIYKGMPVISQAPSRRDGALKKHHLVGEVSPEKEYSVASFRKRAEALIADILKRRKVPVVAGGSGLYVKALVDGLFPSPPADIRFRNRMRRLSARIGSRGLHERLSAVDPASAGSIHPNDERRIIRALEVYHSTGKTMASLKASTRGLKEMYDIRLFGLTAPREEIYKKIDDRVERMFASGAVAEVRRLMKRKLSRPAKAALGLKEIGGYIEGDYDLDTAKALLKMNTRRFAKRQLTWFRGDRRIRWFDMGSMSEAKILKAICGSVWKER